MRLPKLLCMLLLLHSVLLSTAQVGIGTPNPNNSAMLHVESINKGVLFPRMTTEQRLAIPQVNGLIVFDTDSSSLYICLQPQTGWKQLKALASLKDLVAGVNEGDLLIWDGTQWIIKPIAQLFTFYYRDKDGDGYGDQYLAINAVSMPPGYVANNEDCNDDNATTTALSFYQDNDGDGFGNPSVFVNDCTRPEGYVDNPNDCNDNNPAVNPTASEIANGIDDDCDGLVDELLTPDLPDNSFIDSNGDGIDGTESAAVFVSALGNDANPGTKTQPKRTINAGIAFAVAVTKTEVYVGNGTYNERVTLANGISVYGGYSSANWSRAATNEATITGSTAGGRISGIEGMNIMTATTIDMLKVVTPNAVTSLVSNYGMYCSNCTGVTVKNCNLDAGAGGLGTAGSSGPVGTSGFLGGNGNPGSCDGLNGSGGGGGASACGRTGGTGGSGGAEGNNRGQSGGTGVGPTAGGSGGAGCSAGLGSGCAGSPGGNGGNGATGNIGLNGGGGAGGAISGGFWSGDAGNPGSNGAHGNGGGGGGGGGGQGGTFVDDGGGNGGGGGGGGGCGGNGGTGGLPGGGSFGIFIVNSTGIQLSANTIQSGQGGAGGAAGSGGDGGTGANGGNGAATCTGEVGRGGNGGRGGDGGRGGYGGGGSGGPSYALYRSNTTVLTATNTLTFSSGGVGGNSPGSNGSTGASGASN